MLQYSYIFLSTISGFRRGEAMYINPSRENYLETILLLNPHARTLGTTINETAKAVGY